jgi:hypothetical protein
VAEKVYRQEQQGIRVEVIGLSFSFSSSSFFLSLLLKSRLTKLAIIFIGEKPLPVALVRCNFQGLEEVSFNLGKGWYKELLVLALA